MEITIQSSDEKLLKKVEQFAESLCLRLRFKSKVNNASEAEGSQRQLRAIEALRSLSDVKAISDITDPVSWQKALRTDRSIS